MLAGRFTGEYPFFRGAPATMAGVSAAWSFDRFFDERQSPPVKEEQGQPLQQQKGHGKEDGLERGEEVCHAAEDATLATWSVAGGVRRALQDAGFALSRQTGFAGKRQMLTGHFCSMSGA